MVSLVDEPFRENLRGKAIDKLLAGPARTVLTTRIQAWERLIREHARRGG
jgi:hypothetical protein